MLVLIALPGPSAAAIRQRLVAWSAAHVLHPFCWWEPAKDGVVREVDVVRRGRLTRATLASATDGTFAGAAVVLPVAAGVQIGTTLARDLAPYVSELNRVVPPAGGGPVRPVLIVIPQLIGAALPAELFSLEWGANVYVAAEDRRRQTDVAAPDQRPRMGANQLSDEPESFHAHAAHAVATLTGLWATAGGDGSSVLDVITSRQRNQLPVDVQVARCFTDVVDFGYIPDQLAGRVFKPGRAWPNPSTRRFTEELEPGRVLERLSSGFLHKHREALGLTVFEPVKLPPPPEYGILEALKVLWRDFWFRIANLPLDIVEGFAKTVINGVADRIERAAGPGRTWNVVRWEDRDRDGQHSIADLVGELDQDAYVAAGLFPDAWRDLRAMSFGMVDGAPLPEELDREVLERGARRAVVTDPRRIAPDPRSKPEPTASYSKPFACDPLHLDPTFAGSPARWEEPTPLEPEQLEELRRSFLWMVGRRLAANLHEATVVSAPPPAADPDAPVAPEAELPTEADRAKRRRRSRRRVLLSSLAAVLAAAGAIAAELLTLPLKFALPAAVVTFLALPVFLWRLVRRARRRADAEERAEVQRQLDAVNVALERSLRAGDAKRLRKRYGEFLKWSVVIGQLAHAPWVGDPPTGEQLATQLREDELPAALDRRVPKDVAASLQQLTSQSRAHVFEPTWLSGLYVGVERRAAIALGQADEFVHEDLQVAELAADPASDEDSEDPGTLFNTLVAVVEHGDGRQLSENPLSSELLRYLASLPIDALSSRVLSAEEIARMSARDGLGALPPSVAWFDAPENLGELGKALAPSIVQLRVLTSVGASGGTGFVVADAGLIVTARHVVEGATGVTVILPGGAEVAASVEHVAPHTDAALLKCDPWPDIVALAFRDEPAVLGELVVTLGHHSLLRGDPTLAWGLVSAERRTINLGHALKGVTDIEVFQASFPATGGASGSAVVDLDGRVVGVAVARSERDGPEDDYMSFVVPAHELRALLAGAAGAAGGRRAAQPAAPVEAGVAPSVFFSTPPDYADQRLLSQHWKDPTGRTAIALVLPEGLGAVRRETPIAARATETAYRAPLVVLTPRCQLAPVAPADAIAGVEPGPPPPATPPAPGPDDGLY